MVHLCIGVAYFAAPFLARDIGVGHAAHSDQRLLATLNGRRRKKVALGWPSRINHLVNQSCQNCNQGNSTIQSSAFLTKPRTKVCFHIYMCMTTRRLTEVDPGNTGHPIRHRKLTEFCRRLLPTTLHHPPVTRHKYTPHAYACIHICEYKTHKTNKNNTNNKTYTIYIHTHTNCQECKGSKGTR